MEALMALNNRTKVGNESTLRTTRSQAYNFGTAQLQDESLDGISQHRKKSGMVTTLVPANLCGRKNR